MTEFFESSIHLKIFVISGAHPWAGARTARMGVRGRAGGRNPSQ